MTQWLTWIIGFCEQVVVVLVVVKWDIMSIHLHYSISNIMINSYQDNKLYDIYTLCDFTYNTAFTCLGRRRRGLTFGFINLYHLKNLFDVHTACTARKLQ